MRTVSWMTSVAALLALAALTLGVSACGAGKTARDARVSSQGSVPSAEVASFRNDGDNDAANDDDPDDHRSDKTDDDNDYPEDHLNPGNGSYHDKDDVVLLGFGQPASGADVSALTVLIERDYAAAVTGRPAEVCAMMLPAVVKSMPQTFARYGKTCQVVVGHLVKQAHRRLATAHARVTDVHVKGSDGIVFVGSPTMRPSYIGVTRLNGVWRLGAPIPGVLP